MAKKIKEVCPSIEDQMAADWFEGAAFDRADKDVAAAKKYLEILDKHPYPALRMTSERCPTPPRQNGHTRLATPSVHRLELGFLGQGGHARIRHVRLYFGPVKNIDGHLGIDPHRLIHKCQ